MTTLRCYGIEFIEEENARFGSLSSIEEITNLNETKESENENEVSDTSLSSARINTSSTHRLLTSSDILVENLWTFDTDEIQTAFLGHSTS